ncbi:MAG: S49 family peptidase [Siphonobacter aquaeclarae]|nr:S49 family peptidase [Siphonobacter aquaeclarae]
MIETFLSVKWALEPNFHNRTAALALERLASGKAPFQIRERQDPYLVEASGEGGNLEGSGESVPTADNVLVLPIIGTMTRYGGLCTYGTEHYAQWINEANAEDSIKAIVLELNSPGGQVDGTEYLGEVVRQSKKPVVAWVAGMAASAAYWVASQAAHVMVESETSSEVGSIGVLAWHVDASAKYEKDGYKIKIIRAVGSTDKALFNDVEPLSEEVEAQEREALNNIRDKFISVVQSGRPAISIKEVETGKMFPGKEAIRLGMADSVGFLRDAVELALALAAA